MTAVFSIHDYCNSLSLFTNKKTLIILLSNTVFSSNLNSNAQCELQTNEHIYLRPWLIVKNAKDILQGKNKRFTEHLLSVVFLWSHSVANKLSHVYFGETTGRSAKFQSEWTESSMSWCSFMFMNVKKRRSCDTVEDFLTIACSVSGKTHILKVRFFRISSMEMF